MNLKGGKGVYRSVYDKVTLSLCLNNKQTACQLCFIFSSICVPHCQKKYYFSLISHLASFVSFKCLLKYKKRNCFSINNYCILKEKCIFSTSDDLCASQWCRFLANSLPRQFLSFLFFKFSFHLSFPSLYANPLPEIS